MAFRLGKSAEVGRMLGAVIREAGSVGEPNCEPEAEREAGEGNEVMESPIVVPRAIVRLHLV